MKSVWRASNLIRKLDDGEWVCGLLLPDSQGHMHLHWFKLPSEAPNANIETLETTAPGSMSASVS